MKRMIVLLAAAVWAASTIAAEPAAPAQGEKKEAAKQPAGGAPAQAGQQPAKPAAGEKKEAAKPAAGEKKEVAKPEDSKFKFETPDKKSFADLSGATLRTENMATYIGFQFGTGKQDVVYACFDPENAQKVADRAWLFFMNSTNKPLMLRGRNVEAQRGKNVKVAKEKPERFEYPPIRARIGEADVQYRIEVVCGHEARANCHVTIEVLYKEGKNACAFMLHGNLSNTAVPVPNEVKVIPLLGTATLQVYKYDRTSPPWVRPFLTLGDSFLIQPLKGMEDSFTYELKNKTTEKIAEKGKILIKLPMFCGVGESGAGENIPLKGAKIGTYQVSASIDLGPLGKLANSTDLPLTAIVGTEKKKTK